MIVNTLYLLFYQTLAGESKMPLSGFTDKKASVKLALLTASVLLKVNLLIQLNTVRHKFV